MTKIKNIWVPQVVAIIMLVIALNPENPYGYYVLLRIVCCVVFGYLALMAYRQEKKEWTWILGITAFIYNPIFRVSLNREIWTVINVITILVAVATVFVIRRVEDGKE